MNQIAIVRHVFNYASRVVVGRYADPPVDFPTSIARIGDRMLVTHSRYEHYGPGRCPRLPYALTDIAAAALTDTCR